MISPRQRSSPTARFAPLSTSKGCVTRGAGTRQTTSHTPRSRTSPFGDGPSGKCQRSRRPRHRSPRKSAGEQNIYSLCQPQPCPVCEDARTHHPFTNTQSTTKKQTPLRSNTSEPDSKQPSRIPWPQQALLPDDIGKYVVRYAESVTRLGWTDFVHRQRGRGYFAYLSEVKHPARRLLQQYKHHGAPVVLMTEEWSGSEGERLAALKREPHQSATEYAPFIRDEFSSIVEKGQ